MTSSTSPIEAAFALLQQGHLAQAEELMARELQAVTAEHGHGSQAWASAQCDLGNVLLNADQVGRAIECYRQATTASADDPRLRKDHLTYRLNLGLALRMAGRLDESEDELRRGAQDRMAFYGREHPGYAFGLEPLAELLLQRGDLQRARQVSEETVDNFWRNGHPHVTSALALRAEIVAAEATGEPLFPPLDQLPDQLIEQVAQSVLSRHGQGDPEIFAAVLKVLVRTLEARLGEDHQATLNVLSMLANSGRDRGDQAGRVDAIQRVLASYDRQGLADQALMAALGLAMAQSEVGDEDGALRTYASAYARAERIGSPELASQVLRNWGLALREAGQTHLAEQRLGEAVAQARRGRDGETLGRADVAFGLFLQHEGRLEQARAVLEEGLSALDPVHPDSMIGRSHLGAVMDGRSCGCGDMETTITDAFRDFVAGRMPADLLARLDVAIVDGDFKIDVELRREPTQDEIERLNVVVQSAHAEFRRRLTKPQYAG
ncbi:tetratricopeptide repeat protein [Catellatospora sp. NPDC049133]|uniref:tetratricopeptide repeat protein n=1 Tax=Catellatospora sp. NPDC049133 TaxID=3155499 RepID=UPI0033EEEE80